MSKDFSRTTFVVILILALVVAIFIGDPGRFGTALTEFKSEQVGPLLASLAAIALFIERALEVFVLIWRGTEKEKLKASILENKTATKDIEELRKYQLNTRQGTLAASFTVGILLGLAGVRFFEPLWAYTVVTSLASAQLSIFRALDVILTALVIAGGSDGIHKLMQVFSTFMEKTTHKNNELSFTSAIGTNGHQKESAVPSGQIPDPRVISQH